jgi:hypothetical protein
MLIVPVFVCAAGPVVMGAPTLTDGGAAVGSVHAIATCKSVARTSAPTMVADILATDESCDEIVSDIM